MTKPINGKINAIVFAKDDFINERIVDSSETSIQPTHTNKIKHSVIKYNPGITIRKMS